jgi:hypothetical protein
MLHKIAKSKIPVILISFSLPGKLGRIAKNYRSKIITAPARTAMKNINSISERKNDKRCLALYKNDLERNSLAHSAEQPILLLVGIRL